VPVVYELGRGAVGGFAVFFALKKTLKSLSSCGCFH
jgi:uncharacterized membrane protein (Fun14 family)